MKPLYVITLLFMAFTVTVLTGCGKCHETVTVTSTTPATPATDEVQSLVDEENSYRLSQGQTMLSSGLSCTVQQVASGQWLSSASPGYNAGQGVLVLSGTNYAFLNTTGFNQPSSSGSLPNNILPKAIQSVFLNLNYKINCTGFVVIKDDGYQQFDLSSDDGSILTVDGTQVVNNDGSHGVTTKTGTKLIRRGVKSFTLSYAQSASGNMALQLSLNGSIAPGSLFYH